METRESYSREFVKTFDTETLRRAFLIEGLFERDNLHMTYSYIDRVITGGVVPGASPVPLSRIRLVGVGFFLERREMGVFNLGGSGTVRVDGKTYPLENRQALYVPQGSEEVLFASTAQRDPAKFYMVSAAAHRELPARIVREEEARRIPLGSQEDVNKRILRQYLHPEVMETCQLSMGITDVCEGNAWNTFPPHTHDRRMEVYLYFNMKKDHLVMHLMGEPRETRHIVVRNEQAVLSPSWSIHGGVGSSAYSFLWAMAGENQAFDDMDPVAMSELR